MCKNCEKKDDYNASIVIHNGVFHADDVCAAALVAIECSTEDYDISVIRSRNPKYWKQADLVLDVSGQYDGVKYFDHHQNDVPVYENGIKMAACGLYLKHMTSLTEQEKQYLLDHGLYAVQAQDNGQDLKEMGLEHLSNPFTFISTYNCDWKIGVYGIDQDEAFEDAADVTYRVIKNLIHAACMEREAHVLTRIVYLMMFRGESNAFIQDKTDFPYTRIKEMRKNFREHRADIIKEYGLDDGGN